MAKTSGKVVVLKVNQGGQFATFVLEEVDTGDREAFMIWWPDTADLDYIYHSAWLAMLRDAMIHSLLVDVGHEEDSAIAITQAMGSPNTRWTK